MYTVWYGLIGLLLLSMVLGEKLLKNAPISSAIIYLVIGYFLGPNFLNILNLNLSQDAKMIELLAEIVVLVSLFSAGLKLRAPFSHHHWKLSLKLATLTMIISVILISALAHFLFNFPWPLGILLGGILAPTDPVLASGVQVSSEDDRDKLRSTLTGEAGLNDGTAFPIVLLGLTLMGLHWEKSNLVKWALIDVVWSVPVGVLVGYLVGWLGFRTIIFVHPKNDEKLVVEDFIALGLIALSYAAALFCHGSGFLSVFACGLAFARVEEKNQTSRIISAEENFSPALIKFSSQLERIGEVTTVLIVGALLNFVQLDVSTSVFIVLLVLSIRPLSIFISTRKSVKLSERLMMSWFGIRGIGSVYYLSYVATQGLEDTLLKKISNIVLITIAASILIHGISVNPLMKLYERTRKKKRSLIHQ